MFKLYHVCEYSRPYIQFIIFFWFDISNPSSALLRPNELMADLFIPLLNSGHSNSMRENVSPTVAILRISEASQIWNKIQQSVDDTFYKIKDKFWILIEYD